MGVLIYKGLKGCQLLKLTTDVVHVSKRGSVTSFEWNSSRVKIAVNLMEIKTNTEVSLTRPLLVHSIQVLSTTAQNSVN